MKAFCASAKSWLLGGMEQVVADAGGAASIVAAMRGHSGSAAVQQEASAALKNMTFGGAACLAAIRQAGADTALQHAAAHHPSATEDAKFVLGQLQ